MATLKKVQLSLGLVSFPVKVVTAVADTRDGFNVVCIGKGATEANLQNHPPAKTTTGGGYLRCPICACSDGTTFEKGKEVGGQIVIVPREELERLQPSEEVKKAIDLTAHQADDLADTMPAGKVYWLEADPAVKKPYALFVRLVKEREDIAFVAEFAVRSVASLYRLAVIQDALVLRELAWPEAVTVAPSADLSLPSDKEFAMASMLAEGAITDFSAGNYHNKRAESLQAFLASAEGHDMAVTVGTEKKAATGLDLTSQLEAAIAAAAKSKSQAKRPTKRVATRPVRKAS